MKAKSLLLVSVLSSLPLSSIAADSTKAPNPATGAVTGVSQIGSLGSTAPVPGLLRAPSAAKTAPSSGVGIAGYSAGDFKAPAAPK